MAFWRTRKAAGSHQPPPAGVLPIYNETKPPEKHQTIADEIDHVCKTRGYVYDRTVGAHGRVVLRLTKWQDGVMVELVSGTGATTADAWAEIRAKIGGV